MENKKNEQSALAVTSGEAKGTSGEMEKKEDSSRIRRGQLDTVPGNIGSQTVLATLPAGAGTLASTNHIHVQLFDGQVIQITSASLVNSESKGNGGARREWEVEERREGQSGVIGSELTAGGAVTILTSGGKTYILPQPLSSDGAGGGFLITEEVLNGEDVLQSSDVLQEEQVLTISPPQSSLEFPSPVSQPPDALAIATSEVFNEDFVTLPLGDQTGLTDRSKQFQFKADVSNYQISSALNKDYIHPRTESQRESESYSDCSVITIHAPSVRVKNAWLEKSTKECNTIKTSNDPSYAGDNKEQSDPLALDFRERIPRTSENNEKQCDDLDCGNYSSVYSKWCETHNCITKDHSTNFQMNVCSSKKPVTRETEEAINRRETNVVKTNVERKPPKKDPEDLVTVANTGWEDDSTVDQSASLAKLRRSSRIRRSKRIPSEDEDYHTGEPSNRKKRKVTKGDANSGLWECESCDAMFRTKVSRDRHMEEGHVFTCYICGWKGRSKTKYELHISTVHCNQQARCLSCRKDFPSYEAYKQHMKTVHPSNTPIAVKMEIEFESKSEEPEEKEECREEERYRGDEEDPDDPDFRDSKEALNKNDDFHSYRGSGCTYCGKTFLRRSRFLRHLNYHIGNKPYMCTFCNKCFVEKSGLDAHRLTHCPINQPCPQCGKIFKTQRTMRRHLRTHQNKIYSCDFCAKEFRHEESLRVHKSVHKEGGSGNICKVCEKDCKTPYYLQLHMKTKHEGAKFLCLECNRSFKWKQSYRKHKAIHHQDSYVKFKCTLCPRHFLTPSELQLHQIVHSSERKHLCDICGNAFKNEYTRDKHIKTVHQEDREHMCPQCGALFKAKAYLDQHLAHVHTTKERVKCMHCGHDFKTESNLRSHIKIVHNPRNSKYTCKTCNKMFLAPKDLARHLKVHTGIKDYSCPKCCRCFSRKDNMAAHLRTHTADHPMTVYKQKADLVTCDVPPQTPQGIPHILGLPSSISSTNISLPNIPVSSHSIILPNVPASSSDIVISNVSPSNNIVMSSVPTTENVGLCNVSTCLTSTPISDSTVSSNSLTLPNISISSTNVLPNIVSSANNIILSNVSVSSTGMSNAPGSSTAVAYSGIPMSCNLDFSNTQSSNNSTSLCHTHSNSSNMSLENTSSSNNLILASSPASSNNVILNTTPVSSSGSQASHQVYSLHPHIITSTQHQTSTLPSVSPPSSVPSSVLSLSSHPSSSSVLMSQANRTQMVCTPFTPEQVVLADGVLSPVSSVPTHPTDNSQYTQLDPLEASMSSSPSINMGTGLNSLGSSIGGGPAGSMSVAAVEDSVSLSLVGSHHTAAGGVSGPGLSSPTSLLSEAALIIPEKSGVYTIVGEGGKMTPLEAFTLHPVPDSNASSHECPASS
ncbi:uncharacterized protein [Procambarus clarkii]|uniref:uncharacterized protein n=1 Tax=Procambarus clarkii TaxID=6728 RepID=UPI003742BAC3